MAQREARELRTCRTSRGLRAAGRGRVARVSVCYPQTLRIRAGSQRRSRRAPAYALPRQAWRGLPLAHAAARGRGARPREWRAAVWWRLSDAQLSLTPTHPLRRQRRPARDATHRRASADRPPHHRASSAGETLEGADEPRRLITRARVRRLAHPQTPGCGSHEAAAIAADAAGAARCVPTKYLDDQIRADGGMRPSSATPGSLLLLSATAMVTSTPRAASYPITASRCTGNAPSGAAK